MWVKREGAAVGQLLCSLYRKLSAAKSYGYSVIQETFSCSSHGLLLLPRQTDSRQLKRFNYQSKEQQSDNAEENEQRG